MHFLAESSQLTGSLTSGSGFNLWQSLGGLALVFGLLILCLKFLGKLNRRHSGGESSLLTVWSLGPKREIQVLRLGQEVHYIYRHEGAMVLLKQETFQQWEASRAQHPESPVQNGLSRFFAGKFALPSLPGLRQNPVSSPASPMRVGDLLP